MVNESGKQSLKKLIIINITLAVILILSILLVSYSIKPLNILSYLYINGEKLYFIGFFLILIGYMTSSLCKCKKDPEAFYDDLWQYRKTLYAIYIIVVGLGCLIGYIDWKDWKLLLQLTAMIIFIDITIYQTPKITKIWNAEFEQKHKVEKALQVNELFIQQTSTKLQVFSDVIKKTEDYFANKEDKDINWDNISDELIAFLKMYTGEFRIVLELF